MTDLASSECVEGASLRRRGGGMRQNRAQNRLGLAYEEHASHLSRLAFLLTGDASLAEDLVHEAFVRAFARFRHLRRKEAFGAYLRRTVVNLAGKHYRRVKSQDVV